MKKNTLNMLGLAISIGGAVLSILGGIIGMKQQDAAIEEKVTKILAAKNS